MRVLMITELQPSSPEMEITGGVEARTHYLARELERQDYAVTVIARRTKGTEWRAASWSSLPGRMAFFAVALIRGLRAPADVIDSSNIVVHPLAWLLGRLRRKPVIFSYPDVLTGTWNRTFGSVGIIGELVERVMLRLPARYFIANSAVTAGKLSEAGIAPSKITVIPCGFDAAAVDSARTQTGSPDHDLTVVARLVPYKRVDVVLRALAALRELRGDTTMVVIGQGPEESRLRALASELHISDLVDFRGFIPGHNSVLRTIKSGHIFVSASEVEGFGIALVEAMALGVPSVVSDIPAHRETSGGAKGAALFSRNDHVELARKLAQLLGDENARCELGKGAREHARTFTWASIGEQTAALYRQVLEQNSGARFTDHQSLAPADYAEMRQGHLEDRRLEIINGLLRRVGEVSEVLEIGSGSGSLLARVAQTNEGVYCTGIETDPGLARYAQEHYASDRIDFVAGDILDAGEVAKYDFAFSVDVIHHFGNREATFRAIRKTMKPNSIWIAFEPNLWNIYVTWQQERMRRAGRDERHFLPWRVVPELRRAGFALAGRRYALATPAGFQPPRWLQKIERRLDRYPFLGTSTVLALRAVPPKRADGG